MVKHLGSCHCRAIKFEVTADFSKTVRCDCSLCKRKGAIMALIENDEFTFLKGEENLSLYQWNTKLAKHYFCKKCGIYTHHKRRTSDSMGVNFGCFDDLEIDDLNSINLVKGSSLSLVE